MTLTANVTIQCLLMVLLATAGEAQPIPKFHKSVRLVVDANDSIKDQIVSYASGALRKIPDVTVADDNVNFELRVIGLELLSGSRVAILSWVVLELAHRPETDKIAFDQLLASWPEAQRDIVNSLINASESKLSGLLDHGVVTEPVEDLRSGCERMVTSFDARSLESARKQWQQTWQAILRKGNPDDK